MKLRGVQVGRVASVGGGNAGQPEAGLRSPTRSSYIPANVEAQIQATTTFGAKYVDLIYPTEPELQLGLRRARCCIRAMSAPKSTLCSRTWSTLLDQIDPAKLNAMLTAFADGVRGQGERIGEGHHRPTRC